MGGRKKPLNGKPRIIVADIRRTREALKFLDEIADPARYFDMDGKPISMRQWGVLFSDYEGRIIGNTKIGGAGKGKVTPIIRVSTVWLGLNHRFGPGPPLIFETMVFGGTLDQQQWRYSTLAEAKEGHAAAVALVEAREGHKKKAVRKRIARKRTG